MGLCLAIEKKVEMAINRRYKDGKRKGRTPMDIFTGQKQEKDWIELLLDAMGKSVEF